MSMDGVVKSVGVEVLVVMVKAAAMTAAGRQETGEDNRVPLRTGEENDSKEVSLSGFKTFEKMFL